MEEEQNDLEQPKRTKKERTPAQVEAFKKAQEIRKQNAAIKKEKIAQIKEQYKGKQSVAEPEAPKPQPPKPRVPVTRQRKELEKEKEEVIIVKKKKPKTKIIYETDSESDDDIPPPPKLKKEKYVTPQEPQRFYPSNQRHTPYGVFAII
jgi:hypothetical protein